jgi:heme-degrading monooxygenase HmoA
MGKKLFPGRYTTDNDEEVVVFLIGMRINKRWAIQKWLPVFNAMPGMIRELYVHKEELGFLSMESFFGLRTTIMISYWRSTEDLLAYAKGKKHLTAWREFNRKVGDNEAVGIYHETYVVPKGNYEALYGNMPLYGLAKAKNHRLITSDKRSAGKRLFGVRKA